MAGGRNDFSPKGIPDRLGIPSVSFPTPNLDDIMVVEEVPQADKSFRAVTLGTPHPTKPDAFLVWQGSVQGDGMKKMVRRIYVTDRKAQDAYNCQIRYLNEDPASPIFIRSYIERRDAYLEGFIGNIGSPLEKIIGIRISDEGAGYTSTPTAVFFGDGTDAAAFLEVQNGKVVAARMTDGGVDYTSAGSVNITGGGGTGAAATLAYQGSNILLIEERAAPAPGELSGLYLQVVRVYQSFPGPWLYSWREDPETRLTIRERRRVVTQPSAPTPGTFYDRRIEATENMWVSIEMESLFNDGGLTGTSRVEYGFVEYAFPALLFGITGTGITARDGRPILQLNYNHRSGFSQIVQRRTVITYGPTGTLSPPAPFSPRLADVMYDGVAFNVNVRNVLTNSFSLIYNSGTENPIYPFFVETFPVTATTLSATAYMALVTGGTEIIIGSVVTPWKYGLDRMEVTYVVAR